ncbi:hypothetical protein [Nonlabens dokdonensis]|uniref:Uncharacterized protein n=1 Tax=Nonlabens dokdonensis (strain DSM 17205 / KCTC 12402 / DSW-6) TaxID=592029 RepID=L7WBJ4_NONDD|nr:hypothetical protein [Nonlabens dokdonensis]AGC76253.1 hypothetical protein DDD_1126 [Nonlabens dokdonensis DSW-6]
MKLNLIKKSRFLKEETAYLFVLLIIRNIVRKYVFVSAFAKAVQDSRIILYFITYTMFKVLE